MCWLTILSLSLTGQTAPPSVTVCQPLELESSAFDFPGRVRPAETVEVRPEVAGTVQKIRVALGDPVKKGDVLVELAPDALKKTLTKAEAEVKQRADKVKQLDAKLAEAQKRKETTEIELAKVSAEREIAGAQLKLAELAVARVREDLDFTRIRAPITGKVTNVAVKAGDKVAGSPRAATLLATVCRTDPVNVAFDIDERTLLHLRRHMDKNKDAPLTVLLAQKGEKEFPHKGTIDFIGNRLDAKTGKVPVHALFPNADGAFDREALHPDGTKKDVRVRLTLDESRTVLLVPAASVGTGADGKRSLLTVNDKNAVESRAVKVGPMLDGLLVVEDGLKATDWVIVHVDRKETSDTTLSPEDFAKDIRQRGIKPGTVVTPVRSKLAKPKTEREP